MYGFYRRRFFLPPPLLYLFSLEQEFKCTDRNVYWLHKSAWERGLKPARFQPADEFHSLGKWASTQEGQAQLSVTASVDCKKKHESVGAAAVSSINQVVIEVQCPKASCVAFFVRLEVGVRVRDDEPLPIWSGILFIDIYFFASWCLTDTPDQR